MGLADKQRDARIKEKGSPKLSLEFDVFEDNSISMWTHFNHEGDFNDVKMSLEAIRDHLTEFLNDEAMCPFNMVRSEERT
jgi:hypothetical protein